MSANNRREFRLGLGILRHLLGRRKNYGLFGDIQEMYELQLQEKGRFRAALWLWLQIARTLPHAFAESCYWSRVMFGSYLKVTYRNFKRQKLYSFINLSGLAVGMACCILILSYVRMEFSFDRFHDKSDRIYRLAINGTLANRSFDLASTNGAQAPGASSAIPEIENFTRFAGLGRTIIAYEDRQFFENGILWADASVFKIFSFPLLKGNPENALVSAHCAVLTQTAAERYFGNQDPIGKFLTINNEVQYTVTGVMADVPDNSHLHFDILFSFKTYEDNNPQDFQRWFGNFGFYSYLLLKEGSDPARVEEKFVPLVEKHMRPVLKAVGGDLAFILQPLPSIHLHSHLQGEISTNPDPVYIYLFSIVALFILTLACINFMNLATARSAGRAREVGIRKVHGAARGRMVRQFLSEAMIYSFASLIMALILVQLALPAFRSLSGREITIPYFQAIWLIPALVGLALLVGLAAGSYPAFVLAGYQPVSVLKSAFKGGTGRKRFRSVLVTFQFAISLALLIGTGIIFRQIHYMKNMNLGFDQQRLMVLNLRNDEARGSNKVLKQELKSFPGVVEVSSASHLPGWGAGHNAVLPEGFNTDESIMMGIIHVDYDYLKTLGVEFASGRDFSKDFPTDAGSGAIINRAAAKAIGWEEPIGKVVRELDEQAIPRTVVGMIEDYHFDRVHNLIEPLVIFCSPDAANVMAVRLQPGDIREHIDVVRKTWEAVVPGTPMDYQFLDSTLENRYRSEERFGRLFTYFSGLAIFIGCLGLFGMAAFTAEQRTKEIGIRKVLGASAPGLLMLLSRDMGRLILLANVIAWPLAYWFAVKWLQDFAYKAAISPLIFISAALLVLSVALITTTRQSLKAVRSDPVNSLKYE